MSSTASSFLGNRQKNALDKGICREQSRGSSDADRFSAHHGKSGEESLTPIADMVQQMHHANVAFEMIVLAIQTAELCSGNIVRAARKRAPQPVPQQGVLPLEENSNDLVKRESCGSRLDPSWHPNQADLTYAEKIGVNATAESEKFRDYWISKAGPDGLKRDWAAVWRNWCRRSKEMKGRTNGHKPDLAAVAFELARRGDDIRGPLEFGRGAGGCWQDTGPHPAEHFG